MLNSLYDLNTVRVKAHYSYYTVLRRFRSTKKHRELSGRLEEIKDSYRDPMQKLRGRRNAEIHYMNSEMQDDLWQRHQGLHDKIRLEDLDEHLEDLRQGLEMVCKTLVEVFTYSNEQLGKSLGKS